MAELAKYLPDKKSGAYGILGCLLGFLSKDKINGYVDKRLEKIGERVASGMNKQYEENQEKNVYVKLDDESIEKIAYKIKESD